VRERIRSADDDVGAGCRHAGCPVDPLEDESPEYHHQVRAGIEQRLPVDD